MKTDRRDFIKSSAILTGTLAIPSFFAGSGCTAKANAKQVGIQIYSIREQLAEDFVGSIKKLAAIGYKNIEAYGLGTNGKYLDKITAVDFKKLCDDLGMRLVATHSGYFTEDNAQGYIDGALESGLDYLTTPSIPGELRSSIDGYKMIAENFNRVGDMCKQAGLKFGYHNHAFELEKLDGQVPMEILMAETDADKVFFELDLFWVVKGGGDPFALLKEFPGRATCFHVKDASKELESATVGQGIIDFPGLFEANKEHLEYYFVEDERKETPFENITAAYEYLSLASFT